jgi:N-acylneuraminate cytidylyltransferase
MRVLGIIPARGGSKGIPRKNLYPIHGRPLLAYSVDAAQSSRRLTRTILSSDDPEILEVGRRLGVETPFDRPAELSGDSVGSAAVVRHALLAVEAADPTCYDAVVLLEPTAPLRIAADIDDAIERLETTGADAVVSVCRVDAPHPFKMQRIVGDRLQPLFPDEWREGMPRQALPAVYVLNGAVYATRSEVARTGSLWGRETAALVMPPERSINIDSTMDLALAEILLRDRVACR